MAIFDDIKGIFSGAGNFSGFATGVSIFVFMIIIAILLGLIFFFVINSKRYKYKITVFENIAGQGFVPTYRDKAKVVTVGDQGDEILLLKKRKIFKQAYGRKIGKNHFAFAIGSDGYWRNITFGDVDAKLKTLGIEPVDRDMRYMHVAIRRNIKDRYEKQNWLKDNIGLLVGIGSIVLVLVFMWLIFREFSAITSASEKAVLAAQQVLDSTTQVLSGLDNVISNSGVKSV